MWIAYTREDKAGPTFQAQMDAVRAAGAEGLDGSKPRLYSDPLRKPAKDPQPWSEDEGRDPLPARTRLVKDLRLGEGDVVVVQALHRLGRNGEDIVDAMERIGAKGAAVFDASAGRMIACDEEAIHTARAALRAGKALVDLHAERMRRAQKAMGDVAKGGRKPRWSAEQLEKARPVWFDLSKTDAEVRKISGIPERTLHRHFGERGRPLFGREEKPKRKPGRRPKARVGS